MPYSVLIDYVCPVCHKPFQSTHYKQPERCPACRKIYRAKQSLKNYRKRMREGRASSKKRDPAYDGVRMGGLPSVYASGCVIHIRREVAACQFCHTVTDLINGYCAICRGNGANEGQCDNAMGIA